MRNTTGRDVSRNQGHTIVAVLNHLDEFDMIDRYVGTGRLAERFWQAQQRKKERQRGARDDHIRYHSGECHSRA